MICDSKLILAIIKFIKQLQNDSSMEYASQELRRDSRGEPPTIYRYEIAGGWAQRALGTAIEGLQKRV